jgi:HlyD family secretion protein
MKRWQIILILVAVAAAGFGLWRWLSPKPVEVRYRTADIGRGDLVETITANGIINPVRVVSVGTQVSGTVEALYADFNDRVKAGQVLLRLDPALFAARLQASQASLANARANAALQAANARRAGELVAKDYISRQDFETSRTGAVQAAQNVAQAEAQLRQDRANFEFSVIRAPVSGVVISRQVDVGQTVAASFNTPTLFQIALDLTQMQIEAAVAEADIARVKPGQPVDFSVDAYGGRQFAGVVEEVRLNPTTQQNVVTYTVIVKAANPDGALLPGMTANASFRVAERRGVLLVPNAALSFKPEGYKAPRRKGARDPDVVTVFVAAAGTTEGDIQPQPRQIRVGAADDEDTEIAGGNLRAGDAVITGEIKPDKGGGLFSGPPGAPKPQNPNAEREKGGGGGGRPRQRREEAPSP